MVFAEKGRVVARIAEHGGQGGGRKRIETHADRVGTVARGILPGEERHAAGRANRAGRVGAIEVHPFARHPIEVRCIETGCAQKTEMIGAMLVGSDQENIRAHGEVAKLERVAPRGQGLMMGRGRSFV